MLVPGSVFSLLLLAAVCAASHFFSRAPALVAEQLGDEGGRAGFGSDGGPMLSKSST